MKLTTLQLFKYLSDETRLGIVLLLREMGSCACVISALHWNSLSPRSPAIWQCSGESGLLLDRKQGKWVHYRLSPQIPSWAALSN